MALVVLLSLLAAGSPARALTTQVCVSADSHAYLLLTTRSSDVGTQVTSVALNALVPCSVSESNVGGAVSTAFAAGPGPVLPNRMRTTVLGGFDGNALSCAANFDPGGANGQGVLHLPPPGVRTVSVDPLFSTESVVPVTAADAAVPAAVDVTISRTIPGILCGGNTMVFPRGGMGTVISDPTGGEVGNQSVTIDDTSGSRVGNANPGNAIPAGAGSQPTPDGFLLRGDCRVPAACQIMVFIAQRDPGPAGSVAGAAAAGFTVDAALIHTRTESAQTKEFLPLPVATRSPTSTATDIATPTLTATPTRTHTPSPTPVAGDCDGDGQLTPRDLGRLIAIFTRCPTCGGGAEAVAAGCVEMLDDDGSCFGADANGDGCITAGELSRVVERLRAVLRRRPA